MKQITLVTATLGSIDVVVKENPAYSNTVEVGNKRLCFDDILPERVDLRNIDDYHIIIYDGIRPTAELIVNDKTYSCRLGIPNARYEEILAYNL